MPSDFLVGEQLAEILNNAEKSVKAAAEKAINETAREAAQKLRSASPQRTGDYAKGWAVKKEDGAAIVHNKTDYQLTHLLELGHVVRNKKGVYGRAPAHPHIKPVEEWANDEVVRRATEEINGNL